MGLNVEKPSADLYGMLRDVINSTASELKTFEPYSPSVLLGANQQVNFTLVRGLIESADESFGFVTDGVVSAPMVIPPALPAGPLVQVDFEGWRRLP